MEEWRFVQVNDDIIFSYQVSNHGRIRKTETQQIIRGYVKPEGYVGYIITLLMI